MMFDVLVRIERRGVGVWVGGGGVCVKVWEVRGVGVWGYGVWVGLVPCH